MSIATFLHVSTRTIHRDLKNIEKLLADVDLSLDKSRDSGLAIIGSNENIFRLIQTLATVKPVDLSTDERKLVLLTRLLAETEPIKLVGLAKDLDVSITTLGNYLDDLGDWLDPYEVELSRRRGVGIELIGSESAKRKALGGYFLTYFNEELIEQLFLLNDDTYTADVILYYFNRRYLREIDRIASQKIETMHPKLADSDYIGFLVQICISLQRIEKGFCLTDRDMDQTNLDDNEALQIVKEIGGHLDRHLGIALDNRDLKFLSIYLKGSKLQGADSAYYDSVLLSRSVKKLIEQVSLQLNIDLTNDFSLFQGLIAHMEPSVYRIRQNLGSYNPLTDEIKKKYPFLFMATRNGLETAFKDITFPDDETAFIVLHFGSALELKQEDVAIKALVVCPTGIGASKMLASRIKKEVEEISMIKIASITEMETIDVNDYDIVITTVRLPYSSIGYVYVSPLLSEEDIDAIHHFLGNKLQDIAKKRRLTIRKREARGASKTLSVSLESFMREIDEVQAGIRMVLRNLAVFSFNNNDEDYRQLIKDMVMACHKKGLVTDVQAVTRQLLHRESQGGLGVPETSMALFHCRHKAVKEMAFHITHLERSYELKGMHGGPVNVRNLLLLLAPEQVSQWQLEIISLISTSIVEDQEAILVFSSGNEKMIRNKLEEIFYHYLQNQMAKE